MITRAIGLPLCGLIILSLAGGCSTAESKRVQAKGRFLYNGQPLKVSPNASVTIGLFPINEKGERGRRVSGAFEPTDATFTVPGQDGHGIPPGKYRISVMLILPESVPELADVNATFNAANTKIERDIQTDAPILIDLSKPEG